VKLAINVTLSLLVLGLCLWLVWPNAHDQKRLFETLRALEFRTFGPYLGGYVGLLALTHFLRAWRWNNLLRPIGVVLPAGKLLAISSVGFMAILALPARLGELVRPALLRKKGHVSASAVLGTVAVERVVDGLIVSLVVFGCCFALRGSRYATDWMMPMAYVSLAVFLAAIVFLALALRWPQATIRLFIRASFLDRLSPRLARTVEQKLSQLISGFLVLEDRANFVRFCLWSLLYWGANGLGMWVLARGVGLDLSIIGAFATMGIIAVGITLPNSPGLIGQFHYLTKLGLSLYLGNEVADTAGLAYALLLHGIQVVWYVGVGALAMFTSHVRFADLVQKEEQPEGAMEAT
jgi:uncharacterized protein (TIRG00374 family)